MNFSEAHEYLSSLEGGGWKLGLERIHRMLGELHLPQERYATVHIAGTNGKGSVGAMLEAMLIRAGYRTGLYTSPHLVTPCERIRICGELVSESEFLDCLNTLMPLIPKYKCTYFEAITAMALLIFARENVDVAFLEVGLGGRLDATNVIQPCLSIITNVGRDHTDFLGRTKTAIAREKVGIVKAGVPCVSGEQSRVISRVISEHCRKLAAPLLVLDLHFSTENTRCTVEGTTFDATVDGERMDGVHINLLGPHQVRNAGIVLSSVNALKSAGFDILAKHVRAGLSAVKWPGRAEFRPGSPPVLLDVAHNEESVRALAETLRLVFPNCRIHGIVGVLRDKPYKAMLRCLVDDVERFYAINPDGGRGMSPSRLMTHVHSLGLPCESHATMAEAIRASHNHLDEKSLLLVFGSFYTVGLYLAAEKMS